MRATRQAALPSQEELLVDFAERLKRHRKDRRAVHLRLSALGANIRNTYVVRQAASFFHHLIKAEAGQLFRISSGDLVFGSKGASKMEMESAVYKLLQELAHDPVAQGWHGDLDALADWFEMESDYDRFLNLCHDLLAGRAAEPLSVPAPEPANDMANALETAKPPTPAAPAAPYRRPPPRRRGQYPEVVMPSRPFTAADLDRLESALRMLDVDGMMDQKPVAAIAGHGPPLLVFTEQCFAYADLAASVLPNCDLMADPLLFERLAQMIEARVMKTVRFEQRSGTLATSMTLHVNAVLGDGFAGFDRARKRHCNQPVIIELRFADIARSVRHYLDARARLKAAGYRICVKELDLFDFCLFDQQALAADFIRVHWPRDGLTQFDETWRDRFDAQASAAGRGRLILAGCSDADAIAQGRKLGFSLFAGAAVDELMDANASTR
ncbi:MAG: hypothetical protein Tsb0016_14880 [Sphingomonadales bacterium]